MKKNIIYFIIILLAVACSKQEEKFELFSAEAFTFSIDDGWELNASCRVKGFIQNKVENKFNVKLSYSIDIATPDGDTLVNIDEGLIGESAPEKYSDVRIETQLMFDSTYKTGEYKIIFNVFDDYSGANSSIDKTFILE